MPTSSRHDAHVSQRGRSEADDDYGLRIRLLLCEMKTDQPLPMSTRQPARPTACTPAVADSVRSSLNTADDTLDPRLTRPAGYRLTTFTPAIANSVGSALKTADHALYRGANHPAGHRCRGVGHPGRRLTRP
jgi:hypothetical protein